MIRLKINGRERTFDGDPDKPLLWYLRDEISMTGTKFGCGAGLCGALHGACGRGGGAVLLHHPETGGGQERHHH